MKQCLLNYENITNRLANKRFIKRRTRDNSCRRRIMNLEERLQVMLEMDEFKSETNTTKSIKEVLEKFLSFDDRKKRSLHELDEKILDSFDKMLHAVKKRRTVTSKMDQLTCLFHEFTINEGIELCLAHEKDIEMAVPEILWQMEKEFLFFLSLKLESADDTEASSDEPAPSTLSEIEKNTVRYTAGYVIRKLENSYRKKKSRTAADCVVALQEMGKKLETHPTTEELEKPSSNKWVTLVNRGGLYFIQDEVFDLFVTIELLVDSKLSQIFDDGGKGIEDVQKEKLSWVCNNDDVQCVCGVTSVLAQLRKRKFGKFC